MSEEKRALAVVRRRERVLVVRVPAQAARWAGMWQFPDVLVEAGEDAQAALAAGVALGTGLRVCVGERLLGVRHQVTRFKIEIDVYACTAQAGRARPLAYDEVRWCDAEALARVPMPAAHRRVARSLG